MQALIGTHRAELLSLARGRGATGVRVFGSMRRGDASDNSDVDLVVTLAPGPVKTNEFTTTEGPLRVYSPCARAARHLNNRGGGQATKAGLAGVTSGRREVARQAQRLLWHDARRQPSVSRTAIQW